MKILPQFFFTLKNNYIYNHVKKAYPQNPHILTTPQIHIAPFHIKSNNSHKNHSTLTICIKNNHTKTIIKTL